MRDSETAAVSSGVSLAYKVLAFGISAAYAGVAGGGGCAIANTFVNPDAFPVALSIFLLIGIVVGGLGGLSGLVFGAIFVYFIRSGRRGRTLGSLLPDRITSRRPRSRAGLRWRTGSSSSCSCSSSRAASASSRKAGQLLGRMRRSPSS